MNGRCKDCSYPWPESSGLCKPCERKRRAAKVRGRWRAGLKLNDAERELLRRPTYNVFVED